MSCNCNADGLNVNGDCSLGAENLSVERTGFIILGGGCANCHKLMNNTIDALAELGRSDNVEMITDYTLIASFGVMGLPGLVYNGKVLSSGKVLSKDEVKKLVEKIKSL